MFFFNLFLFLCSIILIFFTGQFILEKSIKNESTFIKNVIAYPIGLIFIVSLIIPISNLARFTNAFWIVFSITIIITVYQIVHNVYSQPHLFFQLKRTDIFSGKFLTCLTVSLITFVFVLNKVSLDGTAHYGDWVLPLTGTILNDLAANFTRCSIFSDTSSPYILYNNFSFYEQNMSTYFFK